MEIMAKDWMRLELGMRLQIGILQHIYIYIYRMYTQKKNYILQLKVSRFHDHQAILQSKDQSYLLYCEIGGT